MVVVKRSGIGVVGDLSSIVKPFFAQMCSDALDNNKQIHRLGQSSVQGVAKETKTDLEPNDMYRGSWACAR